jgi:hypothetical protein
MFVREASTYNGTSYISKCFDIRHVQWDKQLRFTVHGCGARALLARKGNPCLGETTRKSKLQVLSHLLLSTCNTVTRSTDLRILLRPSRVAIAIFVAVHCVMIYGLSQLLLIILPVKSSNGYRDDRVRTHLHRARSSLGALSRKSAQVERPRASSSGGISIRKHCYALVRISYTMRSHAVDLARLIIIWM